MFNLLILLGLFLITPFHAKAFDALEAMNFLALKDAAQEDRSVNAPPQSTGCGHGAMMPVKNCDVGSGFLCVNTPPFSTVETAVTLKGTIDIKNNTLSTLSVSVQNEYTNEFRNLNFGSPDATDNCWSSNANYCIDKDGMFAIKVPLGDKLGPYTILVSATRTNGRPVSDKLRISRVTAPNLAKSDIKVTNNKTSVVLAIDLLHSCQFCDFVGVSTGGVTATIKNLIRTSDGGTKHVTEKTNVASSGIFSVCLPIERGSNNITVSVCNAATGYDTENCPSVALDPISSEESGNGIIWTQPPKDFYSADIDPTVTLSFKLPGTAPTSCEETVTRLLFNRESEKRLCPGPDGTYKVELEPSTGINIGIIRTQEDSYPFAFGWGEMVSPFGDNGAIKPHNDRAITTAGGFALDQSLLSGTARGIVNNYLRSDEFRELIRKLPEMMSGNRSGDKGASDEINRIQREIPKCEAASETESGIGFKISKEPKLDLIEIPQIGFKQDTISLVLNAENLKLWAQAFIDHDNDGKPDKRALPLKIGFRKIFSPIDITVNRSGAKTLFLLTGPSTDCAYKKQHACEGKPAILVPKDFIGNALPGGAFVACDTDVDSDCVGVNMLNAQTALISTTVLDAINNLLYCKGSAVLTYIIREKMKQVDIPVDFIPGRKWTVPVGLDLLTNKFNVSDKGIWGTAPALVGSDGFYSGFPKDLRDPGTGFIRRPVLASQPELASRSGLSGGFDIGIAVGEDLINGLLFILTEQNGEGLLDWDYNEIFLKQIGFDAVKECDEFKPKSPDDTPSTLCSLRPRVGELLGSTLTANNYFPQKYPVTMRIKGNRRLPPRIGFFNVAGKQYLDIQIGEADIIFYALQTEPDADRYGNLKVRLGPDGNPLILSMNPADPDPENGPIIRFKLSAQVALEISRVFTDPDDPSRLAVTIRTEPALSKIVFRPVAGGNATVIPDSSLISALNEKINYGINIYADPKKQIKFGLPKGLSFGGSSGSPDQFSALGLEKISFGNDGLQLNVESSQEYIDLLFKLIFTQTLTYGGQKQTFTFPY